MVVESINQMNDDDSQVSHLSYHDDDEDDSDDNNNNHDDAKAAFDAATTGNAGTGGDASTVANHDPDGYAKIMGIKRSRVLIVTTILVLGGIVGGLAYYFTSRTEQHDFEAQVRYVQRLAWFV
jgi:hypothetical protein